MIDVLCLVPDAHGDAGEPLLLAALRASPQCRVTARPFLGSDAVLGSADVVLLGGGAPLACEQVERLDSFVLGGGGLVRLAGALATGEDNACLQSLVGAAPGRLTVPAEIVAHVTADHPITQRLDPSFAIRDRWYLAPAPEASVLLRTRWHYQDYPIAYVRAHGRGQVVVLAGAGDPEAAAHPAFQRLLLRAVRYAGGHRPGPPVGVALVGYGAIGRAHAEAIRAVPGLHYAAVCDRDPARRAEARLLDPDLRAYADLAAVAGDAAVDVTVVSTPPDTHAEVAAALLAAGKHVVVEKPFCLTAAEADHLIALATFAGRALTVYQNRRWDPDYLAIRAAVQEGVLGDVFHVETFLGGFEHPCELWHSHEPISGGVLYDWGSHYVDWLLGVLPGRVVRVTAAAHKRVWHDVTNADQARLQLRFARGEEAEFLYSDIAAAPKPKWYLLGTRGALVADWRREVIQSRDWTGALREEPLALAEAPPRLTVYRRDAAGAVHAEALTLPPSPVHPFHRNLADHLLDGDPLAVPASDARRTVAILEAAQRSATHDARPVDLDA